MNVDFPRPSESRPGRFHLEAIPAAICLVIGIPNLAGSLFCLAVLFWSAGDVPGVEVRNLLIAFALGVSALAASVSLFRRHIGHSILCLAGTVVFLLLSWVLQIPWYIR
jgi:hypothetical protein